MPVKPTEQEDEYFARLEFERRRKILAGRDAAGAEEERLRVLEVARNRCPKCGAHLVPVPYRGVEVDKCSRCQGFGWTAASWTKCWPMKRAFSPA